MTKISREDIHIIARHSNLSEQSINNILLKDTYNDKASWYKFVKLLFISLGVGFTTIGVIFFFAYNWNDLNKFFKIGIIEALIISVTLASLFIKTNRSFKSILLTSASILVGVLYAVFGQIYQTGADAYDLFLVWTLSIILWTLISNFPPLWLIFITLINTTFILYTEQVAHDWSELFVLNALFLFNTLFIAGFLLLKNKNDSISIPNWFTSTLTLFSLLFSTTAFIIGLFEDFNSQYLLTILTIIIVYGLGIVYGLKSKNSFYLSVTAFSLIIMGTSYLIKLFDSSEMLFIICLFIIGSITLVIKTLIKLQKKWNN